MTSAALAKPQLRGLLASHTKKHLIIAIALSLSSGFAFKMLVCDPRKRAYAEFYKTYDAEKDFQRMKAAGLFTSC